MRASLQGADFVDLLFAHGWLQLSPFHWDKERRVLSRVEAVPGRGPTLLEWREVDGFLATETPHAPPTAEECDYLMRLTRRVFQLDLDLQGFHALCRNVPELRGVAQRRGGRMLRCPSLWEDAVKTLFSVNTTWRQTVAMTERLTRLCGTLELVSQRHCFPTPDQVAAVPEAVLQADCRMGYRARPLLCLARGIVSGSLEVESLNDDPRPDAELEGRIRSWHGFGPYAAANLMNLLGRGDHLPVDSWFRSVVSRSWFENGPASDREMVARFEPFRPYRALVYRCWPWDS